MRRPVTQGWGAQGAEPHPYVGSDGARLLLHVFRPSGEVRGALLLFHGDGCGGGAPKAFFPYARELAARGLVVGCVGAQPVDSPDDRLADARLAAAAFISVAGAEGLTTFALGGAFEGVEVSLALAAEASGQVARTIRFHGNGFEYRADARQTFDEVVVLTEEFLVPSDGLEISVEPRPDLVLSRPLQPS